MSRWREQGYVPDSDEEDDFDILSTASSPPRPSAAPQEDPVRDASPAEEISLVGAETASHIAQEKTAPCTPEDEGTDQQQANAAPPAPPDEPADDAAKLAGQDAVRTLQRVSSSSSLSSVGSFGFDSDNDRPQQTYTRPQSNVQPRRDNVQVVIMKQPSAKIASQERRGRSFRRRNPIQLHPYLLEGERYRQTMQARGVRPIRVAAQESQSSHSATGEETQEFVPDRRSPSSSPPRARHLSPLLSAHRGESNEDRYQRKVLHAVQIGHKRRKLVYPPNAGQFRPGSPDQATTPASLQGLGGHDHEVFDVPPSPTLSSSPPELARFKRSRPLNHLATERPKQLPTPITSSEARPSHYRPNLLELDSDTPPRSATTRRLPPLQAEFSSSDSSDSDPFEAESDANDPMQLKKVGRRIRGVLPASWLKLDMQAQKKKQTNVFKSRHMSPTRTEHQKGVAQRIVRSSGQGASESPFSGRTTETVVISDGSEDETSIRSPQKLLDATRTGHSSRSATPGYIHIGLDDTLDDMEHDEIDFMGPPGSRRRPGMATGRKRQLKLTDSLGLPRKRAKFADDVSRGKTLSRSAHKSTVANVRKTESSSSNFRKRRAPALSILDSDLVRSAGKEEVPQFIRIAARQSRRKPSRGRHSPNNKFIRLQTHADTEEANLSLRQWREGTLIPSAIENPSSHFWGSRQPLADRANNQQLRSGQANERQSQKGRAALPSLRSARKEQLARGQTKARLRQSRLHPSNFTTGSAPSSGPINPTRTPTSSTFQSLPWRNPQEPPSYRTAQLEGTESAYNLDHPKPAFMDGLRRADRQFQLQAGSTRSPRNPQLARFLADEDALAQPLTIEDKNHEEASVVTKPQKGSRLVRKRQALRVDVDAREYRQPSDPPPPSVVYDSTPVSPVISDKPVLLGLGPFGTHYSKDFDCFPLSIGTFFHASTFIGSGQLLNLFKERDLDQPTSRSCSVWLDDRNIKCDLWNDDIFSEVWNGVHKIWEPVEQQMHGNASPVDENVVVRILSRTDTFLRSFIEYISDCLAFIDPPDRGSFVPKIQTLLEFLYDSLSALGGEEVLKETASSRMEHERIRAYTYMLVLAIKIANIAQHETVDRVARIDSVSFANRLSKVAIKTILRSGIPELRDFLEESRHRQQRENGVQRNKPFVESTVVSMRLLDKRYFPGNTFWDIVSDGLFSEVSNATQVSTFERAWLKLFTLLPFIEFDAAGVVKVGRRSSIPTENWMFIKVMVGQVLHLYPETSKGRSSSLNDYVRTTLWRCYILMKKWGWKKCEQILNVVFDFFSRRGLGPLQYEESKGSPHFLECLTGTVDFDIQPGDPSFHVFLKCLACSIRAMPGIYPENKIRSIVYRFIPNHGRTYRKEEDVRQEDLDALRNHHDLLCTLYWASPAKSRPRLDAIRGLVQHETSHREACRLNVRAWVNLVKFQLSTKEPYEVLKPFTSWFRDITQQSMSQYRLARSEAESVFQAAQLAEPGGISSELLESTIQRNQAQVLATVKDAVMGMAKATELCREESIVTTFLKDSGTVEILDLFHARDSRMQTVITETLSVFKCYAGLLRKQLPPEEQVSQQTNGESQDYGYFPELDNIPDDPSAPASAGISVREMPSLAFIHDALWRLLSNAFGAEHYPDDNLLMESVNVWTSIAEVQVRQRERSWEDYFNDYSPTSWQQLRDTEQTRKYKAYFMASILDRDRGAFHKYQNDFITAWLTSLVERESVLKFQFRFTNNLVNSDPDHSLLRNLPFLCDPQTGEINVPSTLFRERRVATISSVFANMRDTIVRTTHDRPQDAIQKRQEFAGMLRKLMWAMKANYQELQQGTVVTGAYTEFVQTIVHFLQQYTSDICAIDSFFTDSVAFPLPTADPHYVTGRLGNYALKITDPGISKQLAYFIQSTLERAAVDNGQEYLADQLTQAMSTAYEDGTPSRPTLRRILVQAIFAPYIDTAFQSAIGATVALPVLQSVSRCFQDLLYNFSVTDAASVQSTEATAYSVLYVLYRETKTHVNGTEALGRPFLLRTLTSAFTIVTAALPLLEYIQGRVQAAIDVCPLVQYFDSLGVFIAETVGGLEPCSIPEYDGEVYSDSSLSDIKYYCAKEVEKTANENWVERGDRYFISRNGVNREVSASFATLAEEQERVLLSIEAFQGMLGRVRCAGVPRYEDGGARSDMHSGLIV